MLALENADEILQILDRFTKQKSKDIPPELEEYISYVEFSFDRHRVNIKIMSYVAKTGDTVYRWPTVQYLFREKLRNVIKDFHDTTASIEDLPQCPNVDQFNYKSMKTLLFERFDNFQAAPFTVQRLCELLTDPKKHYSRLDKFMRALEKNILVVSTVEPGRKPVENDDDDLLQANGDISADIISDIEMGKSENKLSTNGTSEKHKNSVANESLAKIEVASSSGTSTAKAAASEEKIAEAEERAESDQVDVEKPAQSATVTSESAEPQTSNEDTEMAEKPQSNESEAVEAKPIVDAPAVAEEKPEIDTTTPEKPEQPEPKVVSEKIEEKTEDIQIDVEPKVELETNAKNSADPQPAVDEKSIDAAKEAAPADDETVKKPKRAASASDEEDGDDGDDIGSKNPSAKKIRLDVDTSEIESATIPEVDLQKEVDILDSISTEIDAQKESELLEEVDPALVDKDPISIEPIGKSVEAVVDAEAVLKSVEDAPPADLLKTDGAVAIPSDLDFTPDEALNELVSSDILAAIPEQPAEEVNQMNDEPVSSVAPAPVTETAPAPAAEPEPAEIDVPAVVEPVVEAAAVATATDTAVVADEMNVESTETGNLEVESAMEAAPIKADEEQMDVDESNSVDAMDL